MLVFCLLLLVYCDWSHILHLHVPTNEYVPSYESSFTFSVGSDLFELIFSVIIGVWPSILK